MNVVAVSVEPEYLKVEEVSPGSDCWDINVELARMQVAGQNTGGTMVGSVQLTLLKADADTIRRALAKELISTLRTLITEREHKASQASLSLNNRANDATRQSERLYHRARANNAARTRTELHDLLAEFDQVVGQLT